jgi:membrane-bound metal-dependent hydrolase YbcI (DUF457 family)
MPSRRTHILVGTASGAAYAAHRAKRNLRANRLVRVAGGAAGGALGGALPDFFESAISSWHRGPGHSVAVATAIVSSGNLLAQWEEFCLKKAEQCSAIPMTLVRDIQGVLFVPVPPSPLSQLLSKLGEIFWEFLAGFLHGLMAGYTSHLALDALTPRCIPLLTRGF